jgi:hypothetical protein
MAGHKEVGEFLEELTFAGAILSISQPFPKYMGMVALSPLPRI